MTAPSGTVTFLFSDIERSTRRWARDRAAMQDAVRAHDRLMRETIEANGGYVFKTIGDAFCAAFASPTAAAAAALDAQRALSTVDFSSADGLYVRMALNTGTADERDGDYFGPDLNFVARLLPLGHGGQILLSSVTAGLVRDALPAHAVLSDLGEHILKDIDGHQRVYQLVAPDLRRDFPALRSQSALQPWLVPEAMRTRYFTGRDETLDHLRRHLVERHRAALGGMGGMGKTQIALAYAVRYRTAYPNGVFWVAAETVGELTNGFVEMAKALQLPAARSSDQEDAIEAVRLWLSRMDGWLLIFDNVEARNALRRFVPERDAGDVLVTSREPVFAELGIPRALDVGELDGQESVRFMLSRTGREDASLQDRAACAQLAAELGHLPLALEQAAAYITETGAPFATYVDAYRKRRLSLLEKSAGLVSHDTVAVTWAANFESVERASPAAAELLRVSALLAPDAIPFELFIEGGHALGGPIAEALAEPDDLTMIELLRPLARYSLVRQDFAARLFGAHRLVQEITSAALSEQERRGYAERVVCALDAAFPEVEHAHWARCERLVSHVASIARRIDDSDGSRAFGRVLAKAGKYVRERGRYVEARPFLERALAIAERAVGPDHPEVASSLNSLANVYRDLGRYAEAQPLHERALLILERALGPDDLEVSNVLNNLAILQRSLGRYAEAQPLHERSLAIRRHTLGPEHTLVAKSLTNLAFLHYEQGRIAEAERLHHRALAILEKALGPDDPDIVNSLNGLAIACHVQGRYAEAQPLFERAVAIRANVLGPDHPGFAASLSNLAVLHYDRGRYAEAQPLVERALAISEKALGPDHPDVALNLSGLADLHHVQGRDAEAIPLYERALAIREKALGRNHPDVVESLTGLADVYRTRQRYSEALGLYERALAIKQRLYGSEHPELTVLRA